MNCPNCSASNLPASRFCAQCGVSLTFGSETVELPVGEQHEVPVVAPVKPAASAPAVGIAPGQNFLGKYQIQRVLGRGGMGIVYEALDSYIGRRVALKTIRNELSSSDPDGSFSERLATEARAAGRLMHPNIVLVYEAGEVEGLSYIVMEYVEGMTLAEHLQKQVLLPRAEAAAIVLQIARALGYAHANEVVHRDIKPANVLLARSSLVKVADFGIAKLVSDSGVATRSGTLMGSPSYMSPEQITNKTSDGRSDLFSLATLYYECLTGLPPFRASSLPALIFQILEAVPAPIEFPDPQLMEAYSHFFRKALAKTAEQRFRDAEAFAGAVEELMALENRLTAAAAAAGPAVAPAGRALAAEPAMHSRAVEPGGTLSPEARQATAAVAVEEPARRQDAIKLRRSLAILGFKNMSGHPDLGWLSGALSEMLAAELAAGDHLRVTAADSVARMKLEMSLAGGTPPGSTPLAQMRLNLGADLFVFGSYTAADSNPRGKIRLDVLLQDTGTGQNLASSNATAGATELVELVSKVGVRLREALGLEPRLADHAQWVRASLPSDLGAARLYCEGLVRLRAFDGAGAVELLGQAIAIEPLHPLPHAALAEALTRFGSWDKARSEARQAVELSGELPAETRLFLEARCYQIHGQWRKSYEIYQRLWKMYPDNLDYVLRLVEVQIAAGKPEDAISLIEAIHKIQPSAAADPRLDLAEATAAEALSDHPRQEAASAKAASTSLANGAQLLLAKACVRQGFARWHLGEPAKAIAAMSQAKQIFERAGDRESLVRILQTVAGLLLEQNDLASAKKTYEEALLLHREHSEKRGIAQALAGIGRVLDRQGDASGAKRRFEEALEIFRSLKDRASVSLTLSQIATVCWQQGGLAAASKLYEDALAAARESNTKARAGESLLAIGKLLTAKGQLGEAWKRYEEALALGNEAGLPALAARGRLGLAELAVEESRFGSARDLVKKAAEALQMDRELDGVGWAQVVLARYFLAHGQLDSARRTMDRASALSSSGMDRYSRLEVQIAASALRGASGIARDVVEATSSLESHLASAIKSGFLGLQLEARLALGEIRMNSVHASAAGRRQLEALERDAATKGFGLIARKAIAVLDGRGSRSLLLP